VVVLPALLHDVLEIVEGEALLPGIAGETLRAVLALAVHARHPDLQRGELGALLRIARSGELAAQLEEEELARDLGRERQAVEARGPLDGAREVLHARLLRGGGERLRVVGDEVLRHPGGARRGDPELAQVGVDAGDEGARLLHRGWT